MAPPKMLRPEQVGDHYKLLFKLLVPSWPECLDEPDESENTATLVASYSYPSGLFNWPTGKNSAARPASFAILVDSWVAPSGKMYLCDLIHMNRVAVSSPGEAGPVEGRFLTVNGNPSPFKRAGAVMGIEGGKKIVVKDMNGLHFFDAETDAYVRSSELIQLPYGLALLKDGSVATVSEKQLALVIVGVDGNIVKEMKLHEEIRKDIETKDCQRYLQGDVSGARIRFMCSNVRKDGTEAVYMVDECGGRIYCVNVDDGSLIWKTQVDEGLGRPRGIVAMPNGNLLVGLYKSNQIGIFDDSGNFMRTLFTATRVVKPQGMYLLQKEDKTTLLICSGNKVVEEPAVFEFQLTEDLLM